MHSGVRLDGKCDFVRETEKPYRRDYKETHLMAM